MAQKVAQKLFKFRNSDIVGESADAPVDRSRIPSLLKLYAVSFHCVPVQQAFYAYRQCHRSIIFANLMILLQNLQQIVEFGHGLGFDGVHQRSLYCLKKPLYVIFAINPHFFREYSDSSAIPATDNVGYIFLEVFLYFWPFALGFP